MAVLTMTYSIEYPLLSLKTTRQPPQTSHGTIPYPANHLCNLQEPIRLAALTFSNRVFRNHPPSSGVHTSLLTQLQSSLELTKLAPSCWEPYSAVLLWICVLAGGVATHDRPAIRAWFGALLRDVCAALEIDSWDVCRWLLNKFLWHNGRLDETGLAFWKEEYSVSLAS